MENSRQCSLATVATAALIGGLAGAVAGLILAPKSGSDFRKDLQGKAETLAEQVEEADLVEKGRQFADDLVTFLHEFSKTFKEPKTTTVRYTQTYPPKEEASLEDPIIAEESE